MAEAGAARKPSLVAPIALAAPVFALLVGLGVWQVERLAWKEDMLARIDGRIHGAPVPLAPSAQWPALARGDFDYTRVSVAGTFIPGKEALIFRSTGHVEGKLAQPGYWVMAPLRLADGATLLVNRGFVGLDRKDDPRRAASLPAGETAVTGLLRLAETRNPFTPADDPAKGAGYTRDPLAIAAALRLERPAPFSLDEDAHAPAAEGLPAGGATVLDIPNNHLSYALTWFGLAATLVAMLVLFLRRRARG